MKVTVAVAALATASCATAFTMSAGQQRVLVIGGTRFRYALTQIMYRSAAAASNASTCTPLTCA
eukprot:2333-Heterococcus_DN1.PRE.2